MNSLYQQATLNYNKSRCRVLAACDDGMTQILHLSTTAITSTTNFQCGG